MLSIYISQLETNMHDVDYYAEHYPMPAFCFTPDAEFPVCNGEKGGFNGEIVSPRFENGIITAFEGGVAHNAVPDRAACTVQEARSGTALWATPPSNAVMMPFSNFGLTSSPLKPPFSPLQTGNSASGVKQKAGIG